MQAASQVDAQLLQSNVNCVAYSSQRVITAQLEIEVAAKRQSVQSSDIVDIVELVLHTFTTSSLTLDSEANTGNVFRCIEGR